MSQSAFKLEYSGGKQAAYSVQAKGNLGSVYESGIVKSNAMFCKLNGNFKSREQVSVLLTVFAKNAESSVSKTSFEMTLFKEDFKAKWINPELDHFRGTRRPASYLRKTFFNICFGNGITRRE